MPGFQFELSQLVNVPGKDQQGRISGRMEFVNEETVYQLSWLTADLAVDVGMFKQGEVALAQLPPTADWMPENSFTASTAPVKSPGRKRRTASKRKSRR